MAAVPNHRPRRALPLDVAPSDGTPRERPTRTDPEEPLVRALVVALAEADPSAVMRLGHELLSSEDPADHAAAHRLMRTFEGLAPTVPPRRRWRSR